VDRFTLYEEQNHQRLMIVRIVYIVEYISSAAVLRVSVFLMICCQLFERSACLSGHPAVYLHVQW